MTVINPMATSFVFLFTLSLILHHYTSIAGHSPSEVPSGAGVGGRGL